MQCDNFALCMALKHTFLVQFEIIKRSIVELHTLSAAYRVFHDFRA